MGRENRITIEVIDPTGNIRERLRRAKYQLAAEKGKSQSMTDLVVHLLENVKDGVNAKEDQMLETRSGTWLKSVAAHELRDGQFALMNLFRDGMMRLTVARRVGDNIQESGSSKLPCITVQDMQSRDQPMVLFMKDNSVNPLPVEP